MERTDDFRNRNTGENPMCDFCGNMLEACMCVCPYCGKGDNCECCLHDSMTGG